MQFNINRTYFSKALARSQRVVEKRNTLAILGNVLLVAQDNCVTLTSTDLELVVIERLPAQVVTPGQTTVSAVMLNTIVAKLKGDQDVQLTLENDQLFVKYAKSQFKITTLDPESFPTITQQVHSKNFTLPSLQLAKLLENTNYAASVDETLYYLNGVYLHTTEAGQFKAVASDTHRMALMSMSMDDSSLVLPGVTISRKTVFEVLKLIDEQKNVQLSLKQAKSIDKAVGTEQAKVDISVSQTQISFDFNTTVLTSRLIDGNFPDYPQVIPKDHSFDVKVIAKDFAEAISRVSVVLPQKSSSICLTLADDLMKICSIGGELVHAEEKIAIDYDGAPFEIGFNASYLQEAMNYFSSEYAQLYFKDVGDPMLIRDSNDENLLFVVMPVRI